ncbi:hypothetical protein G6F55_014171 [Rhizopus delemar]|nr:hypothetical protein G6F55_014171 [Rhizopus delemar]
MPSNLTPRRMNGMTEAGRSAPPALPKAAATPSGRRLARAWASSLPPTESMMPAQRALISGFCGPDRSGGAMTSAAPSARR